jgi:hypothetical protein
MPMAGRELSAVPGRDGGLLLSQSSSGISGGSGASSERIVKPTRISGRSTGAQGLEKKKMPRIKTEELTEGMVVSADIKNMDNMLLIATGVTLSQRQIRILQAWGVTDVEVQDSESAPNLDPLARLTPEVREKMALELKDLFWEADEANPVFEVVYNWILERRAGILAKES